jgi:hypothetical protein
LIACALTVIRILKDTAVDDWTHEEAGEGRDIPARPNVITATTWKNGRTDQRNCLLMQGNYSFGDYCEGTRAGRRRPDPSRHRRTRCYSVPRPRARFPAFGEQKARCKAPITV